MSDSDANEAPKDAAIPDEDENTVVVDRARASAASEPEEDEHTVVVEKAAKPGAPDEDEHTVVVEKAAKPGAPDEDEHTVVVEKAAKPISKSRSQPQLQSTPAGARRRGIATPPVPRGFAPQALESAGAGATEIYRPRAIPKPPPAAPTLVDGNVATRAAAATMPSVARHAKVTARVAVAVFVAACVASVVGLTLIALTLF